MPVEKINDKVSVQTGIDYDPAEDRPGAEAKRRDDAAKAAAAEQRAAHVAALQTERDYLTRQPKVNDARVAAVDAELDQFATKPARRRREKA